MSLLRPGDVLLDRYEILEPAGETALYVTFLAHDAQGPLEAKQASTLLKVVRPELAHDQPSRSFLVRELQRVRALNHPGLIRPNDVILSEERRCVILAEAINPGLSQGVSLHRLFGYRRRENERFSLDEVRKLGVQLVPTLAYVHGQYLCHGDLRLESVLLRPDGVKLCDVGIGRALPRGPYLDAVRHSHTQELLAPEVVAGRPPDGRSDVFALAALYRHLLSLGEQAGWEAFCGEKPALSVVLTRSLSDNPEQRHQTVDELVAELEAVALTGGPLRRRPGPTPLAMAVAAGRLPPEELNRPVEQLVPPEGRRRRNSGAFEIGSVLLPLATSPSGRSSIGSLPPASASAKSVPSGKSVPSAASSRSARSASSSEAAASDEPRQPSRPGAARRGRRSSLAGIDSNSLVSVPAAALSHSDVPPSSPAAPLPAVSEPAAALRPAATGAGDDDVGGMPTRPVTKADLDEVQRLAHGAAPSEPAAAPSGHALRGPAAAEDDIGGMHTMPFTRLGADPQEALQVALGNLPAPASEAAPAPAPVQQTASLRAKSGLASPAAPIAVPAASSGMRGLAAGSSATPARRRGAESDYPDATVEQTRVDPSDMLGARHLPSEAQPGDPGDQPTNAFERLVDSELSSAPPRRPAEPVRFSELPPLSHEPPRALPTLTVPSAPVAEVAPVAAARVSGERSDKGERRGPVPSVPVLAVVEPASPRPAPEPARSAPVVAATTPPRAAAVTPLVVSGQAPRQGPTNIIATTPKRRRGPGHLGALGALALSALVGAVTAVGLVTLLRGHRDGGRFGSGHGPDAATTAPADLAQVAVAPAPVAPQPVAPQPATPQPATPQPAPTTRPAPVAPVVAPPVPVAAPAVPAGPAARPAAAGKGTCPPAMVAATLPSGAAFCIDRLEFPGEGQVPRVNVSAAEAEAACRQQGRRLCSGDEWEAACRGKNRASYPYGPEPRPGVCNTSGGRVAAAGSHGGCLSASGALDMAGNVAEWVRGGLRGGSAQGDSDGRCSRWIKAPPGGRGPLIGFRCCR